MNAPNDIITASKEKCSVRGCPGLPISVHHQLNKCGNPACPRPVHPLCYQRLINKSKRSYILHHTDIFCTIECQKCFEKNASDRVLTWKNDGALGPEDPHHSEYWLVEWLNSDSNFSKWRAPTQGQTKSKISEKIAAWIQSKGVLRTITAVMVANKISHLEGLMRHAHDWCHSVTGEGLKDTDPLGYQDKVFIFCDFFRF